MKTLQTSTGPVAYDERGTGDAGTSCCFRAARTTITTTTSCARCCRRGCARSRSTGPATAPRPLGDGAASAMRFADVAEQLVEQLAPGGAVIVGNSVGGFSAARLAIRRPELVRGPRARRQRRLRRPPAAGPRLLRADGAAAVPARRLPRVLGQLHEGAHRRGPPRPRHRRRDHPPRSGAARGQRAVAKLRLAGARPARRRAFDLGADAVDLGPPRSRDPAARRPPDRERRSPAPSSTSSTPATSRTRRIRRASRACWSRSPRPRSPLGSARSRAAAA